MFEVFDMPDTHESCARRNTTITAPQALELLNNELVLEWARALAGRVLNDSGLTPEAQVDRAWQTGLFAAADADGTDLRAASFLTGRCRCCRERVSRTTSRTVPDRCRQEPILSQAAALVDLCHMLLNSNEFVYMN